MNRTKVWISKCLNCSSLLYKCW